MALRALLVLFGAACALTALGLASSVPRAFHLRSSMLVCMRCIIAVSVFPADNLDAELDAAAACFLNATVKV